MPPVDQVLELNCELPQQKSHTTARGQVALDYESHKSGEKLHTGIDEAKSRPELAKR